MVPVPGSNKPSDRAGAGQVSLQALIELIVFVALLFAGGAALALLIALAEVGWKLAGLGEVRGVSMPWVMEGVMLGVLALPLAWIARRWRSLHVAAPCH